MKYDDPFTPSVFKTVLFDKIRVSSDLRLDRSYCFLRNHLSLDVELDQIANQMVLHLSSAVLGNKFGRVDFDLQYPRDWWEAFKERWLPKWLLSQYPVKYKEWHIHKDCWRVCPHLDIQTDDWQRQVHFEFMTREEK